MRQKGIDLNHDFYVVVGKNAVEKIRTQFTNTISLYKLSNVLLYLFVLSYFHILKIFF